MAGLPTAPAPRVIPGIITAATTPYLPVQAIHRQALALRQSLDSLALPLARAAAVFIQRQEWVDFGYVRMGDHARERFGRHSRWLRDLAEVGRGVEALPGLGEALTGADGGPPLGVVKTRLIAGIATAGSLPDWVGRARRATVRQLRKEIRQAREAGPSRPVVRPEAGRPAPAVVMDEDPAGEGVRLRLRLPRAVRAVWDEARDLHGALEGRPTSVVEFVESLHGEALATLSPLEVEAFPVIDRQAAQEKALTPEMADAKALQESASSPAAASTSRPDSTPALGFAPAPGSPQPSGDPSASSTRPDQAPGRAWPGERDAHLVDPDARIRQLLALQDDLERRLARLLADMDTLGAWRRLRYASLGHYAEECLGMSRSGVRARVHLVRTLEWLPVVARAYEAGRIGLSATLELARFLSDRPPGRPEGQTGRAAGASAALQARWVERAERCTLRRLEDETRAIRRREARADDTRANHLGPASGDDSGEASRQPLSDAEWHRSLLRKAGMSRRRVWRLGLMAVQQAIRNVARPAPAVEATPGVEATLHGVRLDGSGTGGRRAPGMESGPCGMGRPPLAAGSCLHLRLPADLAAGFLGAVESARRDVQRAVQTFSTQMDHRTRQEGGDRTHREATGSGKPRPGKAHAALLLPSQTLASAFLETGHAVPLWVGLLALLEDFVATWDVSQKKRRAAQDVIYALDGYRCMAPGCTGRRNLEDHHVVYRSRRGSDDMTNRVCLCRGHHRRGEHGELMVVRGTAPLGLRWLMGRRSRGGTFVNEMRRAG